MKINPNHIVRSAALAAVGLPISLAIAYQAMPKAPKPMQISQLETLKADLGLPCLKFAVTKSDSRGEREAKDQIDAVIGEGTDYREVCKWVLG